MIHPKMSAAACARAASDLTSLVNRLQRAGRSLDRQARLPANDFGGLSGDAYRRHADRSALTVAALASDLALLAGALAALGRALEAAAGMGERADEFEGRAQQDWREAVARFEGRTYSGQGRGQPRMTEPVVDPPAPDAPPSHEAVPARGAAPEPTGAEPTLTSSLVEPAPLESDLVTPVVRGCGSRGGGRW